MSNDEDFGPTIHRFAVPAYRPHTNRWNRVSNYRDRDGVWIAYDYDTGPYVIMLFEDVVPAAKYTSQNGFGHVAFWPYGMSLHEGLDWWNEKVVEEMSEQLGVDVYEHFHWADDGTAFCVTEGVGAVDFNFEDATKVCPRCRDKISKHMMG